MWQLFLINIVIIVLDIALLAIEYRNLHMPEIVFKAFCYSFKLKLEFAVLGKQQESSSSLERRRTQFMVKAVFPR
ncbi:uncharacterized protein Z518_10576 [Rhinocladiella mackenziei CBS 650.93]|uniref:DUF7703 domain-containing protein n=1 Tax=Rhinocladiella mackenziei CBS 650.93 TaxID=1442369 RepID=A0A0D2FEF9_9EURO|nr:uncharacterized protein Z518_10576 [Rhinocladiella mackenziei CBS 650.93]KIX00437.1 hypothetical protein Z518_10576 [Rhinocladiella mackenziei CBS 650.93]